MAEEDATAPTAVAAARQPPFWTQPIWKKRLLALFVGLATIGLITGLIVAFKPERSKAPATAPVIPGGDKQTVLETPAPTVAPTEPPTPVTMAPTIDPNGPGGITEGPGGGLPGAKALNGVTSKTSDSLTSAMDALGLEALSDDTENFFNTLVKDTSMAGGCTPQNGAELRAMLEDPNGCTIISLLPGMKYNVALPDSADDVTVSSRKVVVGNPIALPTIDGSDCVRLFHIVAGGSLDLQFVRTYRGSGELIYTLPVLRGGTALVELGGRFSAFGVIFTTAPAEALSAFLIAPDISRAARIFGGQIFVTGGIVTITLSHFWTLQPGVLLRETYIIGADMLVVAGVAVLSGCTFTNSQMFLNMGGVGLNLAVLGGVLIASGVTFTLNFMAIHASGAGIMTFIGGGVGIFSGVTWTGNLGAFAHFGSGVALFNGGGVLVLSGCAFAGNFGVAIEAGTAMMISMGGGTLTATGIAQVLNCGVNFYAGAGVLNWVGAGSAVLVGLSQSRNIGVSAAYGIGGTIAVGAGALVTVGAANADNLGVASVVLVGGNYFLGAGIFVEIGSPMVKNAGVLFAVFLGYDAFVGYGAAVVKGSPASINTGVAWINPGSSQYFVGGDKFGASAEGFEMDAQGNLVPKGWGDRELFKFQGLDAFNALKGDCWFTNENALRGADDDEEWYDDDLYMDDDWGWDDDDWGWDDDDDSKGGFFKNNAVNGTEGASVNGTEGAVNGTAIEDEVQVVGIWRDDDDSLVGRDDDDRWSAKRDDDDGWDDDDDWDDDDSGKKGIFGGGKKKKKKKGGLMSLFNRKCERVCKIEKLRVVCTPIASIGKGWDDEYFDDDWEIDDDWSYIPDDDVSFGGGSPDDDVEDKEALDDDVSFGGGGSGPDDDVEDKEALDDDVSFGGGGSGPDDDVEDKASMIVPDDDVSFGGGGSGPDDDVEDKASMIVPDDDVEDDEAADDDVAGVEEPTSGLDDDVEEEEMGGAVGKPGLDDDIEEELDDDVEEKELNDDIEEKELDDDIEEEELDDDIEEEEKGLDDDIEEEELDDDIEEEELDDDIEEEELDDDIEEEELDDDIEEEELDDDIEEEELDDDIEEEEELDDDIEEEELDDDIAEPAPSADASLDDDIDEEAAATTPAPTASGSVIRKLRPFQRLKEAAAGSFLNGKGRKAQAEEAEAAAVPVDVVEAAPVVEEEEKEEGELVDDDLEEEEWEVAPVEEPRMVTSFVVLDGENAFDKGEPNAMVLAVRNGPLGAAAHKQQNVSAEAAVVEMEVDASGGVLPPPGRPAYAAVNGDVYCNMCGFKNGVLDYEVVGESNQACQPMEDTPCTLEGVQVMGMDGQPGSLPGWAVQAGKLFDADSGKLTGQLDTDVVTAVVRVGCSGEDAVPEVCVQSAALEEAIKASLGSECARLNVARKNQEKHPELAGATPSNAALALEESMTTDVFDVTFTSHDAACTATVTQWLTGFDPLQLNEHLDALTPQSVQMDQAAVKHVATHRVPGMDLSMASEAALPSVVSTMRTGATPSLLVNSADASAAAGRMALPSIPAGGQATMAMTGFMRNTPVSFEITSQCAALGAAKALLAASPIDVSSSEAPPKPKAVPIGEFTPTQKGAVTVPFDVPADLPPGTYSVKATQMGYPFCSQPFEVK